MDFSKRTKRANNERRAGRKRSFPHSRLFVASAVALSVSCGVAFQSKVLCASRPGLDSGRCSPMHVVTDPNHLLQMQFDERDRSEITALENMYMLSTREDGLSGELVEESPQQVPFGSKAKTKITKSQVPDSPLRRVQFRGLSTIPDSRSRKKRATLSSTSPADRILNEERASRSSTMPGFKERGSSDRQKAFHDGIKMAEQLSGKKIVDTAEAKKKRRKMNGEMMYKTSASVPDSLVQFANEIHEIDRITPKEEILLGEKTQEAIRLQKIYDGLFNKLEREPSDEEWCAAAGKINMEAISQTIEEGLEAKNRLVTSNLRMVQGVVNVYIRNGLSGQYNSGDLMQEGIMALIRAAEKFDPSRGFRFSTYAMYWIRSAIKRNQIFQSRVVAVPPRQFENHKRIVRVKKDLTKELGRPPTKTELADAVGMSETQVDRCLVAMAQRCYSLDQQLANRLKPMGGSSETDTLYELVASKTDDADYNNVKHGFLREDLIETLNRHLSEEEAMLLLLRYGLLDSAPQKFKNGPLTIAEVSRMVGLKPDKVRRTINKSLKHLKKAMGTEWADYERELA